MTRTKKGIRLGSLSPKPQTTTGRIWATALMDSLEIIVIYVMK